MATRTKDRQDDALEEEEAVEENKRSRRSRRSRRAAEDDSKAASSRSEKKDRDKKDSRRSSRRASQPQRKSSKSNNPVIRYFQDTRDELRKVTWPSQEQTTRLTIIVIGAIIAFGIFLGVLDLLFREITALLLGA
ncbi:MAG: preprotein translocase subunit SecE [Chloroflexi bacterium]|nr:preprotein translocase subunit SecE [Chloroflexota bacterium]